MLDPITDSLYVERFRPHTVEETILPPRIKDFLFSMVKSGQVQNYLACGGAGSGKTSSCKALLEELGVEHMLINMSESGNIDTVRTKIKSYASTMSMYSDYKVIILDEICGSSQTAQQALRGIMEEFAENCRFILTANYGNKIIDALKSRCPVIDFQFDKVEKESMLRQFIKRAREILDQDKIEYDKTELVKFCIKTFPDFRKTLNLLQRNTHSGVLNIQDYGVTAEGKINELIVHLKSQQFTAMRKWVGENGDCDVNLIFRALYDKSYDCVQKEDIPALILILAEFDYKNGFVVDKEINLVAALVTIMQDVNFL